MLQPRAMVVISIITGIMVFLAMVLLLGIKIPVAEDISVLTIGLVLAYMMIFYFIMNGNNMSYEPPTRTPGPT
jgi:hypothetical protein